MSTKSSEPTICHVTWKQNRRLARPVGPSPLSWNQLAIDILEIGLPRHPGPLGADVSTEEARGLMVGVQAWEGVFRRTLSV